MDKKFKKILLTYKKKIDKEVSLFFQNKILTEDNFERQYLKILKEYSLRPAKRLRAILVNAGYLLAGGKDTKEILKTSIFIEIIHNFLLIHDDIIDRDEVRRGKEAAHCYYQNKSFLKGGEGEHFGKSMAIVLGDIANILGYEILINSAFEVKYKLKAFKKLNEISELTGRGQMLEIELKAKMSAGRKIREKDIINIYKSKTAFYTFVLPLQIGAILAGADSGLLGKIEKFAIPLGIAFQIRDDIKEIFDSSEKNQRMSDITEGQPTLLIAKALLKERRIKNYFGKKRINNKDAADIRDLMYKSGAIQYCKSLINNLINTSLNILAKENFPQKEKQFLISLAKYLNK